MHFSFIHKKDIKFLAILSIIFLLMTLKMHYAKIYLQFWFPQFYFYMSTSLLIFLCISKKCYNYHNFRFPVFNGFSCDVKSQTGLDYFGKASVCFGVGLAKNLMHRTLDIIFYCSGILVSVDYILMQLTK